MSEASEILTVEVLGLHCSFGGLLRTAFANTCFGGFADGGSGLALGEQVL